MNKSALKIKDNLFIKNHGTIRVRNLEKIFEANNSIIYTQSNKIYSNKICFDNENYYKTSFNLENNVSENLLYTTSVPLLNKLKKALNDVNFEFIDTALQRSNSNWLYTNSNISKHDFLMSLFALKSKHKINTSAVKK